jgi:23S rRNA (guanosine2251-2'-O)-methyltransferase
VTTRRGGRSPARDRPREPLDADPDSPELVWGVHAVQGILDARSRHIERVLVARDRSGLGRILRRARELGVPVTHLPRAVLDRRTGRGAAHQGVAAVVSAARYADPEEFFASLSGLSDALVVALDRVQDPRNLGAVVRTAAAAGAVGVVVGSEESVGLTSTVAKASAGAIEHLPVLRAPRLPAMLRRLRSEAGFRVLALDPEAGRPWDAVALLGRVVVVAGGEGSGLRPGVREACDEGLAVPMTGGVPALNVSVSVAVVLFEAVRQQRAAKTTGPRAGGGPERRP